MDGIRKYSKEWFTLNQENSNYLNHLEGLKKGASLGMSGTSIDTSLFSGSLEEAQEKYDELVKSETGRRPSSTNTAVKNYGIENIFNALDANQDGVISDQEIKDVAALSTREFRDTDTYLTTEDLDLLYNNAIEAVNSEVKDLGNVKEFIYENGETTRITTDNSGVVRYKTYSTPNEDGGKTSVSYNLKDKTTTERVYDSENRMIKYDYDSPDKKKDRTQTVSYNADGSKTINDKSFVTNITTTYDEKGKLQTKDTKYNYESDGKIDATNQRSIGDCWVLSGVNAINQSEIGKKMLSDALTHNDDGSITVKLKGVNKEYTFSAAEIVSNEYQTPNKKYSSGDTDMNLFEMAIGRYRQELIESGDYTPNGRNLDKTAGNEATPEDPLNGGQIDEAVYYITGVKASFVSLNTKDGNFKDLLEKYGSDKEKYIATVSFQDKDPEVSDSIIPKHAYCVTDMDEENVYLSNPHRSEAVVTYPKDKFYDNVKQLSVADLTEKDKKAEAPKTETTDKPEEKKSKKKFSLKNIAKTIKDIID